MSELRMPDINSVLIAGNLTKDPILRKTGNGTSVTNFWIASNRRFKDNLGQWRENVCFVGVVTWYKLAENCARNLKKGNAVLVEGELQSRSLRSGNGRGRSIVEIKARRVQFLNRKDDADSDGSFEQDFGEGQYPEEFEQENEEDHYSEDTRQHEDGPLQTGDSGNPRRGRFDFGFQELDL
ncbi:single-stranded DNA-binding protein [bacterium]|nr:single-stranded DNA-binding protein [bacterium]